MRHDQRVLVWCRDLSQVNLLNCAIRQVDYAGPLQVVHCMHVRKGVAYLHQSVLIASSCAAAVQLGCD